tara:strand:- start:3259 stop:3414 length:156 start_codon:yes stop_codon:yes gene_type:complete
VDAPSLRRINQHTIMTGGPSKILFAGLGPHDLFNHIGFGVSQSAMPANLIQ